MKGPGLGLESESVVSGTLTFWTRFGDGKLWQACFVRGGLEFLMSRCLSYLREIANSEVFYISSTDSNRA